MRKDRANLGYSMAFFSIFANIFLFTLKYWAGWKYASVAMRADAWHTLSDTVTSMVVVFGIWISSKPADIEHPFGHGRAEEVAAIVLSTLLFVVGVDFLWEALRKLYYGEGASYSIGAVLIFLASALIKEAMAHLSTKVGRKTGYASLLADAWHHRSDALASLVIAIGIFAGRKYWWMDGVMGGGVAIFIIIVGYEIMRKVVNSIMGENMDREARKKIKEMVISIAPMAKDIHHFHIHRYGEHVELTFHICLPKEMTLGEVHEIVDRIERKIREEMGMEATIHVDPS